MKLRFPAILCCWLVLVVAGCHHIGPRFDAYPPDTSPPGGYSTNILFTDGRPTNQINPEWLLPPANFFRLGPGDIIDIEIIGERESAATVLVGPDGRIYYNLLPGTFVWGLTMAEAKNVLEESLAKYILVRPELALSLRTVTSRRIWILGSVPQPGIYTLATPMTVLEAISLAGGIPNAGGAMQELADLRNSFVMRNGAMLPVDLDRLYHKGDFSQNIYLEPDDYVYVRPAVPRDIYVFGAVRSPTIIPYTSKATLVSAVASAGGPVKYAYVTHMAIVRGSVSSPTIAKVSYQKIVKGGASDIRLEPGDIVYVPYAPYQKPLELLDVVMNEFVRSVALNAGIRAAGGTEPALVVPGGATTTSGAAAQ